jgi:hypothetical protein
MGHVAYKELQIMLTRRSFLASCSVVIVPGVPGVLGAPAVVRTDIIRNDFPGQEPELIQEMVVASHGNLARVKELVGRQQTLAKAAWDWGFGDWESSLDAAAHTGNRGIAGFLLTNGARPTIFSAAMLGQLAAVKALVAAAPGIQRTKGPHSISLLKHAVAGGPPAQAVVEYLKSIEGADEMPGRQPLTPEDIAKLSGVYTYGVTPASRVEMAANNGQMTFARPGRFARPLFHLGSYEFCPVGAENVRIRFDESSSGMTLTVRDPDVVLTARKSA